MQYDLNESRIQMLVEELLERSLCHEGVVAQLQII